MNKGLMILKWTALCVLFVILFGYITMLLWNWLLPSIFGLPVINFWQALGLLVLSKILFGGFGGGKWSNKHQSKMHWNSRYQEKLSMMTPEEKERFKARMWAKWCPKDKNNPMS